MTFVNSKLLILLVVLFLCVAVAAFFIGLQQGKTSAKVSFGILEAEHQTRLGIKDNEIQVLQKALGSRYPLLTEKLDVLLGTVKEKQGNKLTVDFSEQVSQFPLPNDAHLKQRTITVLVDDESKIIKLEFSLPSSGPPGKDYPNIEGQIEDILVGGSISVVSRQDLRTHDEVVAQYIKIF